MFLMMMMLGGVELLGIGAIAGYFFRNKSAKNGALIGVALGFFGALIMNLLLLNILLQSILAIPAYAILGSWLFNFIMSKIKK